MCSDTSRTGATLCAYPRCYRTVWQDLDGSYSSFCGRTHMESATKTLQQGFICKNCQTKPVYVENDKRHDFCGMRCAIAYRSGQHHPQRLSTSDDDAGCRLPGCGRPAFKDEYGNVGQYCSQPHRRQAVRDGISEPCLRCRIWPKNILNDKISDFCSKACAMAVVDSAPAILEIFPNHEVYEQVHSQFTTQWKHPTATPTIMKIWKVYGSKDHNDRFSRYKLAVERDTGLQGGNTRRRWHGTVRACTLGDEERNDGFCNNQTCSMCSILQSSFDLAHFGRRTNRGRFGTGIYTSATSSKSNDYILQHSHAPSPYRAILLTEVVMGRTIKLTVDHPNMKEPPAGYDAVVGEPGGILNYDESIVYKNDAIRPVYLILFKQ